MTDNTRLTAKSTHDWNRYAMWGQTGLVWGRGFALLEHLGEPPGGATHTVPALRSGQGPSLSRGDTAPTGNSETLSLFE